ncbi:hypothetical protein, partial [Acetobacter lambici]|uniref:hypothetical protein n=1 Tax=Acetobacter lambici TaxID=1332824 RepID=UPI001A7F0052
NDQANHVRKSRLRTPQGACPSARIIKKHHHEKCGRTGNFHRDLSHTSTLSGIICWREVIDMERPSMIRRWLPQDHPPIREIERWTGLW